MNTPDSVRAMQKTDDQAHAFGRYFDDFEVGAVYRHWPGKTITEAENHLFSLLTMNHHPVHIDHAYAATAQHERPLVVGTLVFSLSVGLSVRDVSGRAVANLGYRNVKHLNPVFCGDTIYATTTVSGARLSKSNASRGIVSVRTIVYNQQDLQVLEFERDVLVPRRPTG